MPKDAILRVRVTPEQLEKIIKYAKQNGTTRSVMLDKFINDLPDPLPECN
jgi:hypothetical protein